MKHVSATLIATLAAFSLSLASADEWSQNDYNFFEFDDGQYTTSPPYQSELQRVDMAALITGARSSSSSNNEWSQNDYNFFEFDTYEAAPSHSGLKRVDMAALVTVTSPSSSSSTDIWSTSDYNFFEFEN